MTQEEFDKATPEEWYSTTPVKSIIRYTFPSILTKFGWYTTLDGDQKLIQSVYHKFDDGTGKNLSDKEKIFNIWVDSANKNFPNIRDGEANL